MLYGLFDEPVREGRTTQKVNVNTTSSLSIDTRAAPSCDYAKRLTNTKYFSILKPETALEKTTLLTTSTCHRIDAL